MPPADRAEQAPGLGALARRGGAWVLLGRMAGEALRFGTNLVLTRLLFPEAFGLMLLVNSILQGLALFSDVGINASVIQHARGEEPGFLRTAWTLQALRGLLLWLVCLAAAGPLAAFYGAPELRLLVPVAGLGALFSGFNSMSLGLLARRLELRRLVLLELCVQAAAAATMIGWAILHPSVWALAAGGVAGSVLRMAASHCLPGAGRPRPGWDRPALAAILGFGAWVFFNSILGFLADQVDRLALGRILGRDELGVYGIAVLLAGAPYLLLVQLGSAVVFPAFSRAREAGRDLREVFGRVRLPILAAGGCLLPPLAAAGPTLVALLYDPRYRDAGWMLLCVCLGQWFRVLAIPPANVLFALGAPHWLVWANAAKLAGYCVLVPLGLRLYAVTGALLGFALGESLGFWVYAAGLAARRIAPVGRELLLTLLALGSAAAGYGLRELLLRAGLPAPAAMAAGALLALLGWLPVALRAWRGIRREGP